MAEKFQLELKKLLAKNSLCLEIWGRLKPFYNEEQKKLIYKVMQQLTFKSQLIRANYVEKSIFVKPAGEFFKGVKNFFNDPLPTHEFMDVSCVLEKYDFLDPGKALNLLFPWGKALEYPSRTRPVGTKYEKRHRFNSILGKHF